MTKPLLRFNHVCKQFDDKTILNNITFEVTPGMVIGLLGKNGAGKTTLLRSAIGLINPDTGAIETLGQPSDSISAATKQQIGYVPQQAFGYEGFRLADALALHRKFYQQWDLNLETLWLKRFELDGQQQVNNLSIGQRQSLALIMAMAYRPKLLILDEPVASLDPIARREFMSDLFDLALESGSGVIFSSHITSDIERVASHIALLKSGEILIIDELDHLRDTLRKVNFNQTVDLSPFKILSKTTNSAVIANYSGQSIDGAISITPLSLEQLFVELHAK